MRFSQFKMRPNTKLLQNSVTLIELVHFLFRSVIRSVIFAAIAAIAVIQYSAGSWLLGRNFGRLKDDTNKRKYDTP